LRTKVQASRLLPKKQMRAPGRRHRQPRNKQASEARQPAAVLLPVVMQQGALANIRQQAARQQSKQRQRLMLRLQQRQLPVALRQTAVCLQQ
jgi:hypothetical protein